MSAEGTSEFNVSITCDYSIDRNSPRVEEVVYSGRDAGLKKSRSSEDESSGSIEAGLGIWKD